MSTRLALWLFWLGIGPTQAGELAVAVSAGGRPAGDAVVAVRPGRTAASR